MQKFPPSFGRRKARILRTQAQQAYEKLELVKMGLDETPFDSSSTEVWLEIGFGGGEHFLAQLQQNPTVSMIGCEPFVNGVAKLLGGLLPEDMPRVRIWTEDVRYLLEKLPPDYFSRTFILFPDPWPKKRHHRRRLFNRAFMDQLLPRLKEGAFLHIASDDAPYVEHILHVLLAYPELHLVEGPSSADPLTWGTRPPTWPSTRYEQKALLAGKPCAYMTFIKARSPKDERTRAA